VATDVTTEKVAPTTATEVEAKPAEPEREHEGALYRSRFAIVYGLLALALVGAGVGGLIGSQFGGGAGKGALTALGVVAGGLLGSQVGASLDRADQAQLAQSMQRSLESAPSGQAVAWQNPDSGHYGTVTPTQTYRAPNGEPCREFQQTITVGGRTEEGYGTACRQPDGTWKIVQ
jgi:surface antigen